MRDFLAAVGLCHTPASCGCGRWLWFSWQKNITTHTSSAAIHAPTPLKIVNKKPELKSSKLLKGKKPTPKPSKSLTSKKLLRSSESFRDRQIKVIAEALDKS